jgi:hypothetical protein
VVRGGSLRDSYFSLSMFLSCAQQIASSCNLKYLLLFLIFLAFKF